MILISKRNITLPVILFAVLICGIIDTGEASESCKKNLRLKQWYAKVAGEIKSGKPLVISQYVALCDNEHQGIVRVSETLGDGDNTKTNLYWGALFGYRTFFKKDKKWKLIYSDKPNQMVAELLVFSRTIQPTGEWKANGVEKPFEVYLVIIGYKGRFIRNAVEDYLGALSSKRKFTVPLSKEEQLFAGGQSQIVSYAGHNYFMDLSDSGKEMMAKAIGKAGTHVKATMVLACKSSGYFMPALCRKNISVIAVTRDFMAPEAYTARAAFEAICAGQDQKSVLESVVKAYSQYQKISQRTARKMFSNLTEPFK